MLEATPGIESEKPGYKKMYLALLFLFFCIAGIFLFFYFTNSVAAFSHVEINTDRFQVGETLSGTAYVSDWEQVKEIDVRIDGVSILTCGSVPSCSVSYTFFPGEIGDHAYEFILTDKKGKKTVSKGAFTVVSDSPEIVELITNNTDLLIGGAFFVQAHATSESDITSAKLYVDGVLTQYCLHVPCFGYVGPFTSFDVGEHTYTFVITNEKGKTIMPGGTFTVLAPSDAVDGEGKPAALPAPELINVKVSKTKPNIGETVSVDVSAKDEKGVAAIVVLVDKKNVGGCAGSNTCSLPIGPFTDTETGVHTVEIVVVNKDGKKVEAWSTITVNNADAQGAPADTAANNAAGKQPNAQNPSGQENTNNTNNALPPSSQENTPGSSSETSEKSPLQNGKPNPVPGTPVLVPTSTPASPPEQKAEEFPVNGSTDPSGPELVYMVSQGNKLLVGDTFSASVVVSDKQGIQSILAFLDGKAVTACEKSTVCAIKKGPFTESDIGSHTYSFLVTNIAGKTIHPGGAFTVQQPASTAIPYGNPPPFSNVQEVQTVDLLDLTSPKLDASIIAPFIGEIKKEPLWIDTDGGIVASVAGQCTSNVKGAPYQKTIFDSCIDKKTLKEYYVDEKAEKCLSTVITCGGVCYAGECYASGTRPGAGYTPPKSTEPPSRPGAGYTPPTSTEPPSRPGAGYTTPLWIDTDGGIKEFELGQCVSNVPNAPYQKSIQDYCIDKKILTEYYLDEKADKCLNTKITCGGLCHEGRCYAAGTRPGAGYTPPTSTEPPSRPGAGYTPPTSTEPPSRPGAGYTPPAEPDEPPSRPGAGYTPPLWIDTDGGIKEFELGQCHSNVQGAPYQKSIQDYCIDGTTLNEFYLESTADKCLSQQITCTGFCSLGVCVNSAVNPAPSRVLIEETRTSDTSLIRTSTSSGTTSVRTTTFISR